MFVLDEFWTRRVGVGHVPEPVVSVVSGHGARSAEQRRAAAAIHRDLKETPAANHDQQQTCGTPQDACQ